MELSVLILGDGNFSFSLALLKKFLDYKTNANSCINPKVVCTSCDSLASVLSKYPEANSIIEDVNKYTFASVLHNVDATQLQNHFDSTTLFDDIIFNFPHLGIEDLKRHRSFLSHILFSAKKRLKSNGFITIALAETQGHGWEIETVARNLDLVLVDTVPLLTTDWPGYEMKRHHTGKSFQTRVQQCCHYVFRSMSEDNAASSNIIRKLKEYQPSNEVKAESKEELKETAAAAVKPAATIVKKTKKRRVDQLVEGLYSPHLLTGEQGVQYQCNECEKLFPTEQGVKTHVYTVHVLSSSSAAKNSNQPAANPENTDEWVCELCNNKVFSNKDAWYQHKIAKHEGNHLQTLPYWKQQEQEDLDVPSTEDAVASVDAKTLSSSQFTCTVCGSSFATLEMLQHHEALGFLPIDEQLEYTCQHCQKQFGNLRAYQQHDNFCQRKHIIPHHETTTDNQSI